MKKRTAFTLVELLVVISIIALLVSILMPALSKARAQAIALVCVTQLKDMGTMLEVYAADHDGAMVRSSSGRSYGHSRWWDGLGDYYDRTSTGQGDGTSRYDYELFKCPTEWKKTDPATGKPLGASAMYSLNVFFMCPVDTKGTTFTSDDTKTFPRFWWSKKSRFKYPSELPVFWDHNSTTEIPAGGNYGDPHESLYEHGWSDGNIRSQRAAIWGPAANHDRNINYLFADGHAKKMGLWPYEDTMSDPEPSDYYFKFFHPTRNLDRMP